MGGIIRLHGDIHTETRRLLPWYVMRQLDTADHAQIEAHLAQCEECRGELQSEDRLSAEVNALPLDMEMGWAALRGRMEISAAPTSTGNGIVRAIRRAIDRPVTAGWFLAAQFVLVVMAAYMIDPGIRPSDYHALGNASSSADGNIIIIFRPDIREEDMRGAFMASGARLVDGPTASGAYVLKVPAANRNTALAKLRAQAGIVLAQPIDAGTGS